MPNPCHETTLRSFPCRGGSGRFLCDRSSKQLVFRSCGLALRRAMRVWGTAESRGEYHREISLMAVFVAANVATFQFLPLYLQRGAGEGNRTRRKGSISLYLTDEKHNMLWFAVISSSFKFEICHGLSRGGCLSPLLSYEKIRWAVSYLESLPSPGGSRFRSS